MKRQVCCAEEMPGTLTRDSNAELSLSGVRMVINCSNSRVYGDEPTERNKQRSLCKRRDTTGKKLKYVCMRGRVFAGLGAGKLADYRT